MHASVEGLLSYPAERENILVRLGRPSAMLPFPSPGLNIKADAGSLGFGEAILTGLGAAGFAPDLFPDLSLAAQHLHRSCQSPELTPSLDDSRRKKKKIMQLFQLLYPWKDLPNRSWKGPRADVAS